MPHAFLVNPPLKYTIELTKSDGKGCKDYWEHGKTFAGKMKYNRGFQLGKEQQKEGGTDPY